MEKKDGTSKPFTASPEEDIVCLLVGLSEQHALHVELVDEQVHDDRVAADDLRQHRGDRLGSPRAAGADAGGREDDLVFGVGGGATLDEGTGSGREERGREGRRERRKREREGERKEGEKEKRRGKLEVFEALLPQGGEHLWNEENKKKKNGRRESGNGTEGTEERDKRKPLRREVK
jgi:hypothetical protein